jgi:hypothetical protein
MRNRGIFPILFLVAAVVIAMGCTSTQSGDQAGSEASLTPAASVGDTVSAPPVTQIAYEAPQYSSMLRLAEAYKYDGSTGMHYDGDDSRNTISMYAKQTTTCHSFYVQDQKSFELCDVKSSSGKMFYLVSLTTINIGSYGTNLYTPLPSAIQLIGEDASYLPEKDICPNLGAVIRNYNTGQTSYRDEDQDMQDRFPIKDIGEIYIQEELYKTNKDVVSETGWLVFEVPESFDDSNAYLLVDLGKTKPAWKLFDVQVEVTVEKNPIYSTIIATYRGGPGSGSVMDIDLEATLSDGQVVTAKLKPVIGEEAEVQGSSGDDYVRVIVNLYSGKRYVLYDDIAQTKRRS